ncbi:MAG: hypothetical protein ACE5GA_04595, partial [Candidatus Zixiibacteriota bacterium]
SWSPRSYDLRRLLESLPKLEVISLQRQDRDYDPSLRRESISKLGCAFFKLNAIRRRITRSLHLDGAGVDRFWNRLFFMLGAPIDQTLGPAVAQIQAVAKKRED